MRATIEEALFAKLGTVLPDLIDQIFGDAHPQATRDDAADCQVHVSHAGDENLQTLDAGRSPHRIDRFTLELWGLDRAKIEQARDTLYAEFDGTEIAAWWNVADRDPNTVWAQAATLADAASDIEPDQQGGDDHDRGERMTLTLHWQSV